MRGLLEPEAVESLARRGSLADHAETTRRIVARQLQPSRRRRLVTAAIEENVLVPDWRTCAPIPAVAARLVRGDLHLHGWVYKIETGEVFAYDMESGQFVPLAQYNYEPGETTVRHRTFGTI